jgi:hypothetical protein
VLACLTFFSFRLLHRENSSERAVDALYQTRRFSTAACWRERRAVMAAQASRINRIADSIEVDMAAAR